LAICELLFCKTPGLSPLARLQVFEIFEFNKGEFMKCKSLVLFTVLLMSSKFALASKPSVPMNIIDTPAGVAQFLNENPKCQDVLMQQGAIKSAILSGARVIAISGTSQEIASEARFYIGKGDRNRTIFKLAVRVGISSGDLYSSPVEVACESEYHIPQ
jgi:hypothetical protein